MGLEGIKLENRFSHLSPFSYLVGGRQVTPDQGSRAQAPDPRLRFRSRPPSGGRRKLPTYSSYRHSPGEHYTLSLDPWVPTCPLPWRCGLDFRACRLTLWSRAVPPAFRRKDTRWSEKQKAWQQVWNFQTSRIWSGWEWGSGSGWGYQISNFWSHYKTLFLIRIEYHLKSPLQKQTKNQTKSKRKKVQPFHSL